MKNRKRIFYVLAYIQNFNQNSNDQNNLIGCPAANHSECTRDAEGVWISPTAGMHLQYFPWNWNALTTKFILFWSRCTLLCIENQAGLSSSIEITDKLHHRGARQVGCAGFAIVSKQNTEYFLADYSPQHKIQRVQNRQLFCYISY